MSIKCLCVDDSFKPNEIPNNKWIKKGESYTVIYTVTVLPQRELAFQLQEIELTEKEYPYEYFLSSRFAFKKEDLEKLIEMIKDCNDIDFDMDELLNNVKDVKES